jgi:hypothetical protein
MTEQKPDPSVEAETRYSEYPWNRLVDQATAGMAGQGAIVEASRRVVRAQEVSERSANQLGKRIWWLNLWLLAFTVAICLLTVMLVLVELGVMKRPHAEQAAGGAWVLWAWDQDRGGRQTPLQGFTSERECRENATGAKGMKMTFLCLPDTVDPRGPKGANR